MNIPRCPGRIVMGFQFSAGAASSKKDSAQSAHSARRLFLHSKLILDFKLKP